jgi:6,7-dimethyl-8-ribityllumazine synthase
MHPSTATNDAVLQRLELRRPGTRAAVVVSTFHHDLTGAMAESARRTLIEAGAEAHDLPVHLVPGSFELPIVARALARQGYDCVLCFGLVIQGETTHDHWVAHGAVEGILRASLETDVPIHLGVLTVKTVEQARARALPRNQGGQDKGAEVARAALQTLLTLDAIRHNSARNQGSAS